MAEALRVAAAAPVLRIVGKLTASTVGSVRTVLAALGGEALFILDLTGVDAVDPPALADLTTDLRNLQRLGKELCLVTRGPGVPLALRAAGADGAVPRVSSVEEARALLEA